MLALAAQATTLEQVLGDAYDEANPCSFAEVLAADERCELLHAGEVLLDSWKLNAEFVPTDLGGRLESADALVKRGRALFRRDAALGLGYGVTSLMAAVNIWAAGSAQQRRRAAQLLLAGERISIAYHELDHGNDLLRNEFAARLSGDRFVLDGSKQVINNIERAAALVLFARTSDRAGGRSHSVFFLEKEAIEMQRMRYLPRYRTAGVRGCLLAGVEIKGLKVPTTQVVGDTGMGAELALRSFQLTRAVLPGLALGSLDTALRCAFGFAAHRSLYGAAVWELPHARNILAEGFADLLAADCLARTVARGLHVLPRESALQAAAVKYLVPLMIEESMADLAVVLGARSYLRSGPYAIFAKHQRDVPALSLGHAGGVACLLYIIAQLRSVARSTQQRNPMPAAALFGREPLRQGLSFEALQLTATGSDSIVAMLSAARDQVHAAQPQERQVLSLIDEFREAAATLWSTCRDITAAECGVKAGAATFGLAARYTALLAAGACVGVWLAERARGDAFLGAPCWIHAALTRLKQRVVGARGVLPAEVREELARELHTRWQARVTFDLESSPVESG